MFPKFECAVSQTDFMHPRKQRLFPENQGLLPKKHWMFTQKTQVWFVLLPYLSLLFCESLYLKQIVLLDACEFLKFKQFVACFAIYDGSREGFHTSGHADVNTLEDVCALVNPSIGVIPIHKDENTQYDMQKVKGYKIFQKSEIVTDKISIILE